MDIEAALSALIDDQDFVVLNERRARFNLFEALGAVRGELRHSNFLAFILSPNRSHGLGIKPLQILLRALLEKLPAAERPIPALEVAVGDLEDATVFREVDYIDLLIEIRELNFVVVIENKVDAQAGDGQLERYKAIVDHKYPKWRKLFVFLTPDGRESDHASYVSFSYIELANLIEALLTNGRPILGPDVNLILDHYIEMIRRNIVDDDALRALAIKIYERHPDAIDFILKCKPQATSLLPVAQSLAEQDQNLIPDKHGSSIARFVPKRWASIAALNSCPQDKWTRTGRTVLFEIKFFKTEGEYSDRILLSLILGPSVSKELRQHLFDGARANPKIFVGAGKTINQNWVTIFAKELLSASIAENMDEKEKHDTIAKNWSSFAANDLPRLIQVMENVAKSAPN